MFYKLQGRKPVKCATGQEWAEWYEPAAQSAERRVAYDELDDNVLISTIFTGIDQGPVEKTTNNPLLFETMTFINGQSTGVVLRHATWEQAETGHRQLVRQMQKARDEDNDATDSLSR